jgi:regulator of protease activity HflC (stomatin/prohibitin superfamily)
LSRAWFVVKPNERAVLVTLGRAQRLGDQFVDDPSLNEDERKRYRYPLLRILGPGWHFKWPWQTPVIEDIATRSIDITWDPTKSQSTIEAVTKDNLTTGVDGQLRWRVAQSNFYAYCFGVDSPLEHVMGYFVSVLRERVANFVDPKGQSLVDGGELGAEGGATALAAELSEGVSINDLRKNLPLLNDYMEQQCRATGARYGIELDAALITQIDPPPAVDRALSAINSTRNQVAADISTARADAEQQITMSKRAVEIAQQQRPGRGRAAARAGHHPVRHQGPGRHRRRWRLHPQHAHPAAGAGHAHRAGHLDVECRRRIGQRLSRRRSSWRP